jgi:tetraacyldisaccharide 4'-kinase
MDDGFQNPSLQKSWSVLVVDARRGIGNGKVFPAGPLRAPLAAQLLRADALVVVGSANGAAVVVEEARRRGVPVFYASLVPDVAAVAALAGKRVLAFAGIGDPQKLFESLAAAGIMVVRSRAFPDHHRFTLAQAQALCEAADREGLVLVTTEKDLGRMQGDASIAALARRALALPVTLTLADAPAFLRLLEARL